MSAIRREFFDWHQPFLPQAAAWLLHEADASNPSTARCDLSGFTCVLSGTRAGRLLLGQLILDCRERCLALVPPVLHTPGSLLSALIADQPVANTDEIELAWSSAFKSADAGKIKPLLPHAPDPSDELGWLALARTIAGVHAELAGAAIDFAAAADAAHRLGSEREAQRWTAMVIVHESYRRTLGGAGLACPHDARQRAIARFESNHRRLILLAVPELNAVQRTLITRSAGHNDGVVSLVHAPPELQDRFDGFGCVIPEAWADENLDIEDSQLHIVDRPGDQARRVFHCIAALNGTHSAGDIAIGAGDESLVPYIKRAGNRCGVNVRWAGGTPLRDSAPVRFLEAASDWLDEPRFANFAALIRHPDVEAWLATAAPRSAAEHWLTLLDNYFADHLHERLAGEWLGDARYREGLKSVHDAVQRLLLPLMQSQSTRPLAHWIAPVLDVLNVLYGNAAAEPSNVAVCTALRECWEHLMRIPDSLQPRAAAADAVRLLLHRAADESLVEDRHCDQIELLGWLELHLDPAPVMVIAGMNDGFIPRSSPTGPFLPDSLRGALGLPNQAQRYARDAYLLDAINHSRASLHLVAGRQSAEGDPLPPSRLVLACDSERLVHRILNMCDDKRRDHRAHQDGARSLVSNSTKFSVPALPPLAAPGHMSVTAFRAYLECPYRFALQYLLKLEGYTDQAVELDPMRFGSLAHDVLCAFGRNEAIAHREDASAIADFLIKELTSQAEKTFGTSLLPAVRVQLSRMEQRFKAFADSHVQHLAEGWRIHHCEYRFDGSIALDFPETAEAPMPLRGTIDRIDFNPRTGEWLILDYKTSESGDSPHTTHHGTKRPMDEPEWADLQLPLYHYLVSRSPLNASEPIRLGYIVLPGKSETADMLRAEWTSAQLEHAWNCARDVVRNIRAGRFEMKKSAHSPYDPFARICQTTVFSGVEATDGEEEEAA